MDLVERKALNLSTVGWFILDEADEMLDMGFFEDVEKILAMVKAGEHEKEQEHPDEKAALHIALFSATMPDPILKVVRKHIGDAEIIVDTAPEEEKPLVDQFCVIVKREDKLEALRRIIDSAVEFYGLVFCATKVETDELARRLVEAGYQAEALHGDLSQEIRERTLRRFRLHRSIAVSSNGAANSGSGEPAILVATDVAARGLDIENLSHVINWDLPNDRETYIHRTGRTGRAGRRGIAISLATLADRYRVHQFSRMVERNLGSGILWLKVPSVKSVMKSLRRRISSAAVSALPEQEFAPVPDDVPGSTNAPETPVPVEAEASSPFLAKVCHNLIERLGAEKAVEALVLLNYGNLLDPARYGPITEFSEEDFNDTGKTTGRGRGRSFMEGKKHPGGGQHGFATRRGSRSGGFADRAGFQARGTADFVRVYVGRGRQLGAGARDIANLLMRAGGIPGRLVDEIEMKDYCSFATLPADAARKACTFSHERPQEPVIRPARSVEHAK
jgi:ATP-dependent RNA helicase DeaD